MEPIKKIKKRIKGRNVDNLQLPVSETIIEEKEPLTFKGFLLKSMNRLLIVCALLLGFLTYAKNDPDAQFIKDKFGYSLDFTYVNQIAGSINDKILDFDIFKGFRQNEEQKVSAFSKYLKLSNKLFTNEDGKIYAIGRGKVALVNAETNSIVIRTTKEVDIFYYNVSESFVSKNDWVDDGDIIGVFNEDIKINFILDGKELIYEEAINYFN